MNESRTSVSHLYTRIAAKAGKSNRMLMVTMVVCAGAAAGLTGCGSAKAHDSFLDPSVMGSWEHTPSSVPILERIASIEDERMEAVEYSDPTPGDLIPQPYSYRIGPGDDLRIVLWDLISTNQSEESIVTVDARGYIDLPQLGRILVGGKTVEESIAAVQEPMKRLVGQPLANVIPVGQRQLSYTLMGSLERPGPYVIIKPDFRLLEAIAPGGRVLFSFSIEDVYVIRQIALSEEVKLGTGNAGASQAPKNDGQKQPDAVDLLKVIDEIAPGTGTGGGQPGMLRSGNRRPQPPSSSSKPQAPVVGLVDEPTRASQNAESPTSASNWVFLNGKWVQLRGPAPVGPDGQAPSADQIVTQRVIRVPYRELIAGNQSVNIVIRPGDVIRIPEVLEGLVYVGGQVQRPGIYNIPTTGPLTLLRVLDAAGGLSAIGIPERIDLTRMVGSDRQATIMLDGRAIAQQTQPDILLKPNDRINVGTNFWALPLAVLRNGFRSSYGFGFVLDRNISNDIFGPPPVNQFGQ